MSSRSRSRRGGNIVRRWVIPLRTEIAVLALPAALLGVVASRAPHQNAYAHTVTTPRPAVLRVCADANNLPFSNEKEEGFENRIASLIARDLKIPVHYTWWPQRRGFVRNTLKAGVCDVVIGVPTSYELTAHTAPYYRSTYVFVTRAGRHAPVRSFDDPALRQFRIGIHMMGDDYANSPAALALAKRGLGGRIVPFMIYGDYSKPNPPAERIRAVATDSIDVAVAWGPLAGYYAKRSPTRLIVTPVSVDSRSTSGHERQAPGDAGFAYSMAMGVRRGDSTWKATLDAELARRRTDIRRILEEYGVPLVDREAR